jgi:signal transduction histidine kinase
MKLARPSGATLVTLALLVLVPTLAVLQYRWAGQLGEAASERLRRNVRNMTQQFRSTLDDEIGRALVWLQMSQPAARDGSTQRFADRYDAWVSTAAHTGIVSSVFVVDAEDDLLRLRRWDPANAALEPIAWPPVLAPWRGQFEESLDDFRTFRRSAFERSPNLRGADSLFAMPLRSIRRGPQSSAPAYGFTIVELDMAYIREQLLPELAARHFTHVEGDEYRVAVTSVSNPTDVLFRSDPDAPLLREQADAWIPLLGGGNQRTVFPGPRPEGPADPTEAFDDDSRGRGDPSEEGRWRLLVQHESGSLEAAVTRARRRNLGISFGVLLLLTGSVGLLVVTSRQAHELARQQMEFVAGVSHELRTPVAVIRSAAENLSHGVVDGGERVKRYGQLVETEARRLGEMVESVLQYAGIASGIGPRSPASLTPSDIIDGALESSMSLLDPEKVTVQRTVAQDLPPVVGDATALRSAVHNLIANAVKYGGRDGWVGISARLAGDKGRPEVLITVSDHGAGIPPAEVSRIFEPFYRGADAVERQVHGNGLGLALVQKIVAAHGGSVTVHSKPGFGSMFTIALPAAEPDARPAEVASELQATHS